MMFIVHDVPERYQYLLTSRQFNDFPWSFLLDYNL